MEKLQFKGKEFKGSEGEFEMQKVAWKQNNYGESGQVYALIDRAKQKTLCRVEAIEKSDYTTGILEDINSLRESDEICKANTKLFSNSKNLLRAAIEIMKAFDESNLKYQDWLATQELSEAVEKLETEILKSL